MLQPRTRPCSGHGRRRDPRGWVLTERSNIHPVIRNISVYVDSGRTVFALPAGACYAFVRAGIALAPSYCSECRNYNSHCNLEYTRQLTDQKRCLPTKTVTASVVRDP